MLENIKLLIGPAADGKDELLTLLLELAKDDAISKTGNTDVLSMSSVITEMVVYKFNRLGTEGLDSEDYSGVRYSYTSDYPANILSALESIRKSQSGKGGFRILW